MTTDQSLQLNINKMLACYQSGQYEMAKNLALSITKQFPNHNLTWKVLATIYGQAGQMDEALMASQKAMRLDPKDAEAHNNMGFILFKLNRFHDAEVSCKKAIELKADFAEAHNNLGITLENLSKLEEAEASYKKTIKLKPDFVAAHYNLGSTLHKLNRFEESESSYRKAIELKPDFVEAYNNLGTTQKKLDKLEEAETNYKKAIELKPKYAEAYNNLANTLKGLGKLNEAEASYRKAIELKPDFVEAHTNLNVLLKQNRLMNIIKNSNASKSDSGIRLTSNPFTTKRRVEAELVTNLYKINSTKLDEVDIEYLRYGNGRSSDYRLFENNSFIMKNVEEDLISIMKQAVKSDIFIMESFFNIFQTGSGIAKHNHINDFDRNNGLINQKYSLVYYLSVGDQNCNEPGILKLYNPDNEILPSEGMITIFPADRKHTAVYGGKTDRVVIGINFYSLI